MDIAGASTSARGWQGVSEGGLDIDGSRLDRARRRAAGSPQGAPFRRRLAPTAAQPSRGRRKVAAVPARDFNHSSLLLPAESLPSATSTTVKRLCCLSLFIHISFVCPSSFPCCSVPHFGTLSPLASLFLYWFACPSLCSAQPALSCACLSVPRPLSYHHRLFRLRLPSSPDLSSRVSLRTKK